MMVTGSTGVYGGPEEAPEMTAVLAKGALEADASGLSYDIPDQRTPVHQQPKSLTLPIQRKLLSFNQHPVATIVRQYCGRHVRTYQRSDR